MTVHEPMPHFDKLIAMTKLALGSSHPLFHEGNYWTFDALIEQGIRLAEARISRGWMASASHGLRRAKRHG